MNRDLLVRVSFLFMALIAFIFTGCGKSESTNETGGVVVERTFGAPVPATSAPAPSVPVPEPSADDISLSLPEGSEALTYINSDEVNIRDTNSTNGGVLGKVSVGSIVPVVNVDYGNGWSKIVYDEREAFVASQYITVLTNEQEIPFECSATVNSSDVNIRADSTTNSQSLGTLADGTVLSVIKKDAGHGWSMVFYNGKVSFVSSRYIDFDEADASLSPSPSSSPLSSPPSPADGQ